MKGTFWFPVKAFVVSAALAASGASHAITIINPGFEAVPVNGYAYQEQVRPDPPLCPSVPCQDFNNAAGFGWTFAGLTGLTVPSTAFDPPTNFSGQAAFLQGWAGPGITPWISPTISQSLSGFVAGATYQLSFDLGSRHRNDCCDGNQTVEALVDATVIGSWTVQSFANFSTRFQVFGTNAGGTHTLMFRGADNPGDHTAFIDNVAVDLVSLPVPEPTSLALLGIGLAGAGITRRRKQRSA